MSRLKQKSLISYLGYAIASPILAFLLPVLALCWIGYGAERFYSRSIS